MTITIIIIPLIAIPLSSSSNISAVQLTRATSMTFFFASLLSFSVYYATTIGVGVSLYSGLFHVSTVPMAIELFIFIAGGLILLPWASSSNSPDILRITIIAYPRIIALIAMGVSFLILSADLVSLYYIISLDSLSLLGTISMYLAIGLHCFAVYILVDNYINPKSTAAAGLKYFLLSALCSAFLTFTKSLIQGGDNTMTNALKHITNIITGVIIYSRIVSLLGLSILRAMVNLVAMGRYSIKYLVYLFKYLVWLIINSGSVKAYLDYSTITVKWVLNHHRCLYYFIPLLLMDFILVCYQQSYWLIWIWVSTMVILVGLLFIGLTLMTPQKTTTYDKLSDQAALPSLPLVNALLVLVVWIVHHYATCSIEVGIILALIQVTILLIALGLFMMFLSFVLLQFIAAIETPIQPIPEVNHSNIPSYSRDTTWSANVYRPSLRPSLFYATSLGYSPFSTGPVKGNVPFVFNLKDYLSKVFEVDDGGPTTNVHILAFRHLRAKLPPTLEIINKVLVKYITITQEEFDFFETITPVMIELPIEPNTWNKTLLLKTIGGSVSGLTIPAAGVYVYTDTTNNEQLVGSSRSLHTRVRSYWQARNNKSRMARAIADKGMKNFNIAIYILPVHINRNDLCLALEQYYIFKLDPKYNIVPVAGGGARTDYAMTREEHLKLVELMGHRMYIYSLDKTLLHAIVPSKGAMKTMLDVDRTTIRNVLARDGNLWNLYYISETFISTSEPQKIDVPILRESLRVGKLGSHSGPKPKRTGNSMFRSIVLTYTTTNEHLWFNATKDLQAFSVQFYGRKIVPYKELDNVLYIPGVSIEYASLSNAQSKYPNLQRYTLEEFNTTKAYSMYDASLYSRLTEVKVPKSLPIISRGFTRKPVSKPIYVIDPALNTAKSFDNVAESVAHYLPLMPGKTEGQIKVMFHMSLREGKSSYGLQLVHKAVFESKFNVTDTSYIFPAGTKFPVF